jgi:hypothetical protein
MKPVEIDRRISRAACPSLSAVPAIIPTPEKILRSQTHKRYTPAEVADYALGPSLVVFHLSVCIHRLRSTESSCQATRYLREPSTVTGHVYLSDTKGPARKATVYLHSVAALEADTPPRRGGTSSSGDGEIESIGVQTRLDGSFSFDGIKPGTYCVIGEYSGYISPYLSLGLAEGRSPYGE